MTTPNSPKSAAVDERWRQVLTAGPQCLPVERLDQPLSPDEEAHVSSCARCQTERQLFATFEANAPDEHDGLAVQWIAAKARAGVEAARSEATAAFVPAAHPPSRRPWIPVWALTAASLAIIAGGAALLWTPGSGPAPPAATTAPTYRASGIDGLAPSGDVDTAPTRLEWTAVPGAAQYAVRLLEVDGTELWRLTTSSPAVDVPSSQRTAFLPAKMLIWRVEATDSSGRTLASSAETRVRVRVARPAAPRR